MRLTRARVCREKKRSSRTNCSLLLLPYNRDEQREPLLSTTVYIRHTSESLRSASSSRYARTLRFHRGDTLSSLYPCASSLATIFLSIAARARENPAHTLSALTFSERSDLEPKRGVKKFLSETRMTDWCVTSLPFSTLRYTRPTWIPGTTLFFQSNSTRTRMHN